MHTQTTAARADRHAKRREVKALVERLGPTADPDVIREAAYREGTGKVSAWQIVAVRNELWPDRPKRTRGPIVRAAAGAVVLPPGIDIEKTTCPRCGSAKTGCYHRHIRTDGTCSRFWCCQECQHKFKIVYPTAAKLPRQERLRAMLAVEKECTKCKALLPVERFGKKSRDLHLYRSWCNECLNRTRRESHRSSRSLVSMYGITAEQYDTMLAEQGGVCKICQRPETNQRRLRRRFVLSIDHCHKTNKVRGLLCNKCNLGIGNFDDDVERMTAAVDYLRQHPAT